MKRLFAVLIMLPILCAVSGCAEQTGVFVTPKSTGETESVLLTDTSEPDILSEPETVPVTSADTETVSVPETIVPDTGTNAESKPLVTEAESRVPVTQPETTRAETTEPQIIDEYTVPVTEPVKTVHASSISLSYRSYKSKNEKTPYVLESPVYGVLYSGKRAQVGDSLSFSLTASPANHTDRIVVEVSGGLDYSLYGDTLRVTVIKDGNYGMGRVSIYALAENGSVSASNACSFVVDPAGDPFADPASVFSDYIRLKGMQYTSFSEGYTASDPSKSVTHYPGAPAWDDMIDRSSSDWIKQCFDLIDLYKSMGLSKVNFIITDISVGFSAAI